MKIAEDMFAALGAGDLRLAQLVNLAQQLVEPERGNEQLELIPRKATGYKPGKRGDIQIQGVGNLMTQMAGCCQPLPGMPSSVTSPRAVVSASIARIARRCCSWRVANPSGSSRSVGAGAGADLSGGYHHPRL